MKRYQFILFTVGLMVTSYSLGYSNQPMPVVQRVIAYTPVCSELPIHGGYAVKHHVKYDQISSVKVSQLLRMKGN
jgi:hypothetical protein